MARLLACFFFGIAAAGPADALAPQHPLLGTVARETGVDYSILAGRIDRIKDIPYGQLTLAVTGGDMEAAFARFTAADVHMEVLR